MTPNYVYLCEDCGLIRLKPEHVYQRISDGRLMHFEWLPYSDAYDGHGPVRKLTMSEYKDMIYE